MSSISPVEQNHTAFPPLDKKPETIAPSVKNPEAPSSYYEATAIPKPKTESPLPQPAIHATPASMRTAPPAASHLLSLKQLTDNMIKWQPGHPWPVSDIPKSLTPDDIVGLWRWILQLNPAPKEPELVAHIRTTFELLLAHFMTLYTGISCGGLDPYGINMLAMAIRQAPVQEVLEKNPQEILKCPCVIKEITNIEATIMYGFSDILKKLMIQTGQKLPPDLPADKAKREYDDFRSFENQGPLYTLEYLAQRTGKSPQEALELLPAHFWKNRFEVAVYGEHNDGRANFLAQLSHYIETPIAFLQSCPPKAWDDGLQHTRLQRLVGGMFQMDPHMLGSNKAFQSIYRSGAIRIASALLNVESGEKKTSEIITTAFIDQFQRDRSMCKEYSACFALILEKIHSPALLERAIACITQDLACSDLTLRESIFRMARSGTKFNKDILAAAALGPAYITTQSPSETWDLWRTSLIKSTPKHDHINERDLIAVKSPKFLNVAEVFTRAIELAHAIGFSVLPNHEGILTQDTVAFVAAVMNPREVNIEAFAIQLNKENIPIKPDPYALSLVTYLADMIVIPTQVAMKHATHTQDMMSHALRACALALAEGRTTLNQSSKKSNNEYNLLTFPAAALRLKNHCNGIAQKVSPIPTHNQFHPILSARGKAPVTMWTDPITAITIQEIDTNDFRLCEARSLGHCGGATPQDREQQHYAQYAIRKGDLSIATFDVSLEKDKAKSFREYIRQGAGQSCEIPFGARVLRVNDIGGPGDTKHIPSDVTAAWERFAQFLQKEATIPENRLSDKPPLLAPIGDDPVMPKCGYNYKNAEERLRVFELVCKNPELKGQVLALFRQMFKEAQTPEQWVLG